MTFCDICGHPLKCNLGDTSIKYTGQYCEGHPKSEKFAEILKEMWGQPLKIYDEDLENLKWGYSNKEITRQMMDVALQRGEITIHQYIKILKNQ